jgi:hypothetical protein
MTIKEAHYTFSCSVFVVVVVMSKVYTVSCIIVTDVSLVYSVMLVSGRYFHSAFVLKLSPVTRFTCPGLFISSDFH